MRNTSKLHSQLFQEGIAPVYMYSANYCARNKPAIRVNLAVPLKRLPVSTAAQLANRQN
jgi:hypothetical protein